MLSPALTEALTELVADFAGAEFPPVVCSAALDEGTLLELSFHLSSALLLLMKDSLESVVPSLLSLELIL